jgi:hypothetical protein
LYCDKRDKYLTKSTVNLLLTIFITIFLQKSGEKSSLRSLLSNSSSLSLLTISSKDVSNINTDL